MADRDWAEERVDVVCKGWALAKRSKAKIATALRQAREEGRPKWQTIDTAPRDGSHFLTWDAHYGIRIGRCVIRADHDDWLSYVGSHGDSSKGGARATHWASLPTPPGDDK